MVIKSCKLIDTNNLIVIVIEFSSHRKKNVIYNIAENRVDPDKWPNRLKC